MGKELTIGGAIVWTACYFGVMLLYTAVDVAVWRKVFSRASSWLNTVTIALCACGFLALLKRAGYAIPLLSNITLIGVLMALGCSALFYVVLDHGLDPLLEKAFPASERAYQETIQSLRKAPVPNFIQISILAPVMEEALMRGLILHGLIPAYGAAVALLVSSALFALLHFNMVQTLSAFLCGVALGLLYLQTGSVGCCVIAHCGYNVLSYVKMISERSAEDGRE